jgi:hypothetical protein
MPSAAILTLGQMARTLQDRLALANVKVKHGWQHRSLVTIEPEIERELKRKRVESNIDMFSDTSSVASTGHCFSTGAPASSPLTAPLFSDDITRSGSSARDTYNKRFRNDIPVLEPPGSSHSTHSQGGRGRTSKRKTTSWKSKYELPQSSPTHYRSRTRPTLANDRHGSFISEQSTALHSPSASEDDDQDLPLPAFRAPALPRNLSSVATPHFQSSPPRTPSPSRSPHLRTQESIDAGKEGADLLLYLAASPSPAVPVTKLAYPSTPDPPSNPLPSSHMTTPGLNVWDKFQPITPGTAGFNFSEFCNISPSPAQQAWRRTPAGAAAYGMTPRVQLESRRRLDFEGEVPVASRSPTIANSSQGSVGTTSSVRKLEVGPDMEIVKRSFGNKA